MLEEDPIRVSRTCTNVRLTSKIDNGHVLVKCAANITVLALTIAQYNVQGVDPNDVTLFHLAACNIAITARLREYRQYQTLYQGGSVLHYWTFNLLD